MHFVLEPSIVTVWEYSTETEAQRVLHAAHQIVIGFYRLNNFYVVPHDIDARDGIKIVKFPNLPYNQIPRFWDKARLINIYSTIPMVDVSSSKNADMVKEVEKLLISSGIRKPDYETIKTKWEKASKEVFEEIAKIMPQQKSAIKKIVINPTLLGTGVSFSWTPDKNGEMHIFLREDQNIHSIVEAVLTTLTRKGVYEELNGTWSESELLVDWLVTKSSIANVLKKYEPNSNYSPTLKGTREKQNAAILKISDAFYRKLGLSIDQKVFDLSGEDLLINRKRAENLTQTEKLLLKLLIQKANNVASFDELGDILFKSEDDFSLYAISKQIERLRNKLEENGVSSSYIQTLRGQGYILKN